MQHTIKIHNKGKITEHVVDDGSNLLKVLNKNDVDVSAPCGGKGTCGKCKVKVGGLIALPNGKEAKLLGEKNIEKGFRLACYHKVTNDLDIFLSGENEEAKIISKGMREKVELDPMVSKIVVELKSGSVSDQQSNFERLMEALPKLKGNLSRSLLQKLPDALAEGKNSVTVAYNPSRIVSIEAFDTTNKNYGIAIDIGTTTIAAYLMDLKDGSEKAVYSSLNPQKIFGADVISRINWTIEQSDGLSEMHKAIVSCINNIIIYFTDKLKINREDIYTMVVAGNTTMMHFLIGLPSASIAAAPFIPVTAAMHEFIASELEIEINDNGTVIILPAVAAYVGADTVAAILSSGLYKSKEISLLVDIGTNGEIALGCEKWMYACSVAAGPAFEGAQIQCGIGGVEGAIDKVSFDCGIKFTTIGGAEPIGICGSGIVDSIAQMLKHGIIDETGRIVDEDEMSDEAQQAFAHRIIYIGNAKAFLLVNDETGNGSSIVITQKDIREIQNAKAAIAAGIKILAKEAKVDLNVISKVYLAGGFGSYIDIESALAIGLLPIELRGKISSIGNAAGMGAVQVLLSSKMTKKVIKIKEKCKYIELSSNREFVDEYVNSMTFE